MKNKVFFLSALFVVIFFSVFFIKKMKPVSHKENERKEREYKAEIAIVLDDWGYNERYIDKISQTNVPLAVSILPNLYFSKKVLEETKKRGGLHDALLHLPLESKSGYAAEKNTIRSDMTEEEIIRLLDEDIDSLPGIVGASSHQGSKATEDPRLMRIIFTELKKRNLFFLDSITSPNSVCSDIAKEVGIKILKRDVFLDITDQTDKENFKSYVEGQMKELSSIALKKGKAIGIGHNIGTTFQVIEESVPMLEERGIRIVPLRELAR